VFELVRIGMPDRKLCRCFTAAEAAECWHTFSDRRILDVHEWIIVVNEGSNVTDGVLESHAGHSLTVAA
jgi:hypothetical protein